MTDDEREAAIRRTAYPIPAAVWDDWQFTLARLDAARTALESAEVDLPNHGAAETANRLREVAEQGRASGAFGGSEVEAAAQAILALRARAAALEAALRELLVSSIPNPRFQRARDDARRLLGEK